MTRIIAIANQKGGVGKTTTAVNLAASLCAMKRRVLLIDLDPQGNATTGAGLDKRAQGNATVYQVLLGERKIADVRVASPTGGFDIVPSNRDLAGAEIELVDLPERETRLKDALSEALSQMKSAIDEVAPDYDFILLDCPPSLSLLTLNGLCAAHSVLIPMQCEYYALEGLSDLVQTLKKVRAHLNPTLEIEGLLRIIALQQECAVRRLTVFRRPHLSCLGESARLALREQGCAEGRIADIVERCVPAIAFEIGRRMDVEDCRTAARTLGHAVGQPVRGIIGKPGPRNPARRLRIIRPAAGRRGLEMSFRNRLLQQHVAAPLIERDRAGHEEQDQKEHEAEESPGAHWHRFSTGARRISKCR